MNNLINNNTTINSREVAEMINERHDSTIRKIETISENLGKTEIRLSEYFIETVYRAGTRDYKCYEITFKGIDLIIQHSRKTPKIKNLIDFLNEFNYYSKEVVCVNRFEESFGQALMETLKPMNVEVETQKSMVGGKYRIDFYLPQYNLAIEYDEEQHKYQTKKDLQRQGEIERELNCKTIRLDYEDNDNYNVGVLINEIMKGMVA